MTVTLDLTPDTEARLRQRADTEGLDFKEYLQHSLQTLPKTASEDYGRMLLRPQTDEEIRARKALLQLFSEQEDEEEGEPGWDLMSALADNPIQFREWHSEEGATPSCFWIRDRSA